VCVSAPSWAHPYPPFPHRLKHPHQVLTDCAGFASSVEESMRGMGGGGAVVLAKVDPGIDLDAAAHSASTTTVDPEVAKHFEGACFWVDADGLYGHGWPLL
jgi:hypothetical protein